MFGKLLKQEIKAQSGTMCGLYAILMAATLLVSVFKLWEQYFGGALAETVYAIAAGIYFMTLVVLVAAGFIYLCVHFYQTMYSAQGYLTHTLPVRTSQILNAKILVSACYLYLTGILVIISFLAAGLVGGEGRTEEIKHILSVGFEETGLGISGAALAAFFLLLMALGCVDALLMFFAGSSIGQLAKRSRGAYGIAAGIGLYYATQIITILVLVLAEVFLVYKGNYDIIPVFRWMMAGSVAVAVLWGAVYYTISRIIVQKHLNLE